ncbi:uncharacterized protein TNCV_1122431 [Trichonephila clavipes]|nr:uncharacterized protein TNCV_1122431 [Trichonephila clavipes]
MAPHTITPAEGAVCRYEAKAALRRSPRGLHTRTRLSSLLRLNPDSSLKTNWFHSAAVQFPRARHHSKRRRRWVGVKGSTRNGRRGPKCPSARCLRMVQEDTGTPSEGATCAWIAVGEAVGCKRAFLTMWQSSRRLVCRGRSKPGLRVNDISRIHWSQHFLTTQSERPNGRATRLADHPASIMPMILPLSNCDSCKYCLRKRRNGMSASALTLQTIQHTQTNFGYLFYTPRKTTLNALYRLYCKIIIGSEIPQSFQILLKLVNKTLNSKHQSFTLEPQESERE